MANSLENRAKLANVPLAFLLTVLTGSVIGFADPNPMIERGYGSALAATFKADSAEAGIPTPGSEAFWLSQGYRGQTASQTASKSGDAKFERAKWSAPVTQGEQLVLGKGAGARTLEVVAVELVPEVATRIDLTPNAPRFLVSCRDTADPDGRLIRIVVEAETALPVEPQTL